MSTLSCPTSITIIACHLGNSTIVTFIYHPICVWAGYKGIIDCWGQPIETDKISLRHFPLSLRIEPYIFGETVHYKIGTIVSVIL